MVKNPNTDANLSDIMGAISLRVLWAIVKTFSLFVLVYGAGFSFFLFSEYIFEWDISNWNPLWKPLWIVMIVWAFLYDSTRQRCFHSVQWYFPKMNVITSFFTSAYIVLSIWIIFPFNPGNWKTVLAMTLYLVPAFVYYTMLCGYYLVMMRRYPDYKNEDFAIPMPMVLSVLSEQVGGISGYETAPDEE
jgi:cation transport ATPase